MKNSWIISLCCLLSFVGHDSLQAQRPDTRIPVSDFGGSTGNRGGSSNQREVLPDTFGVFAFQVDNPNEERPFSDSLLTQFHQFDPTRQPTFDYINLGIVGSAHQPLVYQPRMRGGFDLGFHQYDLYYTTGKNLPFYRLERPYTNLQFIQGSEQADNIVNANFSRNFADGINFVIDYRAITQTGESFQYPNQNNRTRSVSTGLWYHSAGGRYDGFLSYSANTTSHEDNGGLITLPATGGEFTTPASAEPFLTDGLTRHALREVMYTQYFRFGGRTDSMGNTSRAFTLSHQIDYDRNKYRYADEYSTSDDSFYVLFPELKLDERGARYYLERESVSNSFRLSTYKLASNAPRSERQQRDLLEVGLTHQYHQLWQEPEDSVINNLMLTGKIGLRPTPRLQLQAEALLALLDQAGDFRITGSLAIDLGKAGILRVNANNQLYTPTLLQNRFLLTQKPLWDEQFSRTLETNIGASYTIPGIQISVGGTYNLLNNYIYFDTSAIARQLGKPLSILQLHAAKDFRWRKLHFNNQVSFQAASEDVVRLPNIFGKHSLFYAGKWFKVLSVQVGADLRYTTAYSPYYYNPMIGQFVLQNRQEVDFYPNVDVYFSMRVTRFRAFFKWENLTASIDPVNRFFLTAFYPNPGGSLRFGISWRMLD